MGKVRGRPSSRPMKSELKGMTPKEASETLGVHLSTVYKWFKTYGLSQGLPRGERHHNAKFSEDDVRLIWECRGHISQDDLAEKFDCSSATISNIWTQTTWYRVTSRLPEGNLNDYYKGQHSRASYPTRAASRTGCECDTLPRGRWTLYAGTVLPLTGGVTTETDGSREALMNIRIPFEDCLLDIRVDGVVIDKSHTVDTVQVIYEIESIVWDYDGTAMELDESIELSAYDRHDYMRRLNAAVLLEYKARGDKR